jgi:ribosome-binding factor A
MSQRTARVDELLREEISEVVRREVDDPRIGFVTITDVEVTPDLRHASVWISVIGSAEERKQALRALSHAMPFVRGRLGRLRLKRIPELHVKEDDSAERGTRVLQILEDIEQGGVGEVEALDETLPTPTGVSAVEPVERRPRPKKRRR